MGFTPRKESKSTVAILSTVARQYVHLNAVGLLSEQTNLGIFLWMHLLECKSLRLPFEQTHIGLECKSMRGVGIENCCNCHMDSCSHFNCGGKIYFGSIRIFFFSPTVAKQILKQ